MSLYEGFLLRLATEVVNLLDRCVDRSDSELSNWATVTREDFKIWMTRVGSSASTSPAAPFESHLQAMPDAIPLVTRTLMCVSGLLEDCLSPKVTSKGVQEAKEHITEVLAELHSITSTVQQWGLRPRTGWADSQYFRYRHDEKPLDNPLDNPHFAFFNYLTKLMLLRPRKQGLLRPVLKPVSPSDWLKVAPTFDTDLSDLQHRLLELNVRRRNWFCHAQNYVGKFILFNPIYSPEVTVLKSLDYPKLQKRCGDRQVTKCPCCCEALPAYICENIDGSWIQHLVDDIHPYSCIAADCHTPATYFANRKHLDHHMKEEHGKWRCMMCGQADSTKVVTFSRLEELEEHLKRSHPDALPDPEQRMLTLDTWHVVSTGLTSCPLCNVAGPVDDPDLIDHVVQHTYDFAFLSIPWPKNSVTPSAALSSARIAEIHSWMDDINDLDDDPNDLDADPNVVLWTADPPCSDRNETHHNPPILLECDDPADPIIPLSTTIDGTHCLYHAHLEADEGADAMFWDFPSPKSSVHDYFNDHDYFACTSSAGSLVVFGSEFDDVVSKYGEPTKNLTPAPTVAKPPTGAREIPPQLSDKTQPPGDGACPLPPEHVDYRNLNFRAHAINSRVELARETYVREVSQPDPTASPKPDPFTVTVEITELRSGIEI